MPTKGPVAQGLHQAYEKLIKKHGEDGHIPMYDENGVYNFYLKMEGPKAGVTPSEDDKATANTQSIGAASKEGTCGNCPNGRQGRHP